jgi:WD40 repeat protein
VHTALFHPHRQEFIAAGEAGLIRRRYDWDSRRRHLRILDSEQLSAGKRYKGACWNASGDLLACVEDDRVRLFTAQTNWVLHSTVAGLNRVALSADGKWVAALPYSSSPRGSLWEVGSGRRVRHFTAAGSAYLSFSPDSRWLVTGAGNGYDFQSVRTGAIERRIARENNYFQAPLAFSQDGRLLAVAPDRTTIRVLNADSGEALFTLTPPDPPMVSWLCFNHTGTHLAVAGENNLIQIWDLGIVQRHLAPLGLDWNSPPLPPAAHGLLSPVQATAPETRPIEFEQPIPRRSPALRTQLLDLTAHYNKALDQPFSNLDNHLAELLPGLHTFGGVQYDVRGRIQLQGAETDAHPDGCKTFE